MPPSDFDLEAYLARIAYHGPLELSLGVLDRHFGLSFPAGTRFPQPEF